MGRIGRLGYYMAIVEAVRLRSTCDRGKAGAIIVKGGRILTTGYVGSPAGLPHCDEVGHEMLNGGCVRTVHAEMNAILQAAKFGVILEGGDMYCTMFPCYSCAKCIINVGIKNVISRYRYRNMKRSKEVMEKAGISCIILEPRRMDYDKNSGSENEDTGGDKFTGDTRGTATKRVLRRIGQVYTRAERYVRGIRGTEHMG